MSSHRVLYPETSLELFFATLSCLSSHFELLSFLCRFQPIFIQCTLAPVRQNSVFIMCWKLSRLSGSLVWTTTFRLVTVTQVNQWSVLMTVFILKVTWHDKKNFFFFFTLLAEKSKSWLSLVSFLWTNQCRARQTQDQSKMYKPCIWPPYILMFIYFGLQLSFCTSYS